MSRKQQHDQAADAVIGHGVHLRSGFNISTWPEVKFARAMSHLRSMQSLFLEWDASIPISATTTLRPDRRTIDVKLRVRTRPPLDELALTLGDYVHNLRSSLDAMTWEMATFGGRSPSAPRAVAFPICSSEREWTNSTKRWIGEIEPEFQERIRFVQPFVHSLDHRTFALRLLHELDNRDKHRQAISVDLRADGFEISGSTKLLDETAVLSPIATIETPLGIEDDALLMTLDLGAPMRDIDDLFIRPISRIQIELEGQHYELPALAEQLSSETRRTLEMMQRGIEIDHEMKSWTDINIKSGGS